MRLWVPPITGNTALDTWLNDIYQGSILAVGHITPCWVQSNVAATQTNVVLNLLGSATNTEIVMPVPGDIIGISVPSI